MVWQRIVLAAKVKSDFVPDPHPVAWPGVCDSTFSNSAREVQSGAKRAYVLEPATATTVFKRP